MVHLNSWLYRFLENYVYTRPEQPGMKRTKPMEVLCVGFPRSTTESLQQALLKLGYDPTYNGWDIVFEEPNSAPQWDRLCSKKFSGPLDGECTVTRAEFDAVIGHAVAVTGTAGLVFAADLIAAYPEAKVILNPREDIDARHRSVKETFVRNHSNWVVWLLSLLTLGTFWPWRLYVRFMWPSLFRALDGSIETGVARNGKWTPHKHNDMVRGLVSKDRLLEWAVEDGWEPLCEFLSKPVPREPFPHTNAATGWQGKKVTFVEQYIKKLVETLVILSAIVVGVIVLSQSVCFNCGLAN
ncbi:hypothetical protein F4677DRAFT_355254 [Hypoxylon crocopeplum]|nr:hypothetical protein F4677DRAFT_355254 [Hypoxylon crocopeplum]